MNKSTIEIYRHKKHIKGYGISVWADHKDYLVIDGAGVPRKETILNAICDFYVIEKGKKVKVYDHVLRTANENEGVYENYKSDNLSFEIPRVDLVYYLDIYWQKE